jgi:hypothetical protein
VPPFARGAATVNWVRTALTGVRATGGEPGVVTSDSAEETEPAGLVEPVRARRLYVPAGSESEKLPFEANVTTWSPPVV